MRDAISVSSAFGQRLRIALASADINRRQLAAECKVSPAAVSKWTTGICYPSSSNLLTISEVTGASMEWLMWPRPVDIRSTEYAPDGVHVKELVRAVVEEMADRNDR